MKHGGSRGGGEGTRVAPRDHLCLDVCDTGLFGLTELDEFGTATLASPEPESRWRDADHTGGFVIVENFDRVGHAGNSELRPARSTSANQGFNEAVVTCPIRRMPLGVSGSCGNLTLTPPAAFLGLSSWARASRGPGSDKLEQQ